MVYMKHPIFGNRMVLEAEVADRKLAGWVKWPRSPEEKRGAVEAAGDKRPVEPAGDTVPEVGTIVPNVGEKRKPGRPKKK